MNSADPVALRTRDADASSGASADARILGILVLVVFWDLVAMPDSAWMSKSGLGVCVIALVPWKWWGWRRSVRAVDVSCWSDGAWVHALRAGVGAWLFVACWWLLALSVLPGRRLTFNWVAAGLSWLLGPQVAVYHQGEALLAHDEGTVHVVADWEKVFGWIGVAHVGACIACAFAVRVGVALRMLVWYAALVLLEFTVRCGRLMSVEDVLAYDTLASFDDDIWRLVTSIGSAVAALSHYAKSGSAAAAVRAETTGPEAAVAADGKRPVPRGSECAP